MYLLWTPIHAIVKGKYVYNLFMTDEHGENGSILYAKLFVTKGSASGIAETIRSRRQWYTRSVTVSQGLRIRKHQLKVRGKGLFSLPINTPARIFADAYEDAGMSEEAGVLRS